MSAPGVVVIVQGRAIAVEPLAAHLEAVFADTRRFPDCEGIDLHWSRDEERAFAVIEHWASPEAYAEYHRWRSERGDIPSLLALVEGRVALHRYDSEGAIR